ncbi:hypothetical protein [Undibacterium sp.]|uniref:hypothetical protein n=1 Tax=Undibacterium sp. TaxID=1914977 RepID=UPI0025FEB1B8|nr:hypothetical protein [Undibacterium sp.]
MRKILFLALPLSLIGCASIVNDSNQPIKIETTTRNGQLIKGASCKLNNDFFSATVLSGDAAMVHRSSKDMNIQCESAGHETASGKVISRANAGMAGNILFGGAVGAVIDHNKGTAYTYPTWIRLVFGQNRIYDRRNEQENILLMGRLDDATTSDSIKVSTEVASVSSVSTIATTSASTNPVIARPGFIATGFARIDDIDAVPYLGDRGRESYLNWLEKSTPKAFAIASNGYFGWAVGNTPPKAKPNLPSDASERALQLCESSAKRPCKLYAVNGSVVWVKDSVSQPPSNAMSNTAVETANSP